MLKNQSNVYEGSCANTAHASSASLLFSFLRGSCRKAFSDPLLPTILSAPMRMLTRMSVNLIVVCGVQFASFASSSLLGVLEAFRTFCVAGQPELRLLMDSLSLWSGGSDRTGPRYRVGGAAPIRSLMAGCCSTGRTSTTPAFRMSQAGHSSFSTDLR